MTRLGLHWYTELNNTEKYMRALKLLKNTIFLLFISNQSMSGLVLILKNMLFCVYLHKLSEMAIWILKNLTFFIRQSLQLRIVLSKFLNFCARSRGSQPSGEARRLGAPGLEKDSLPRGHDFESRCHIPVGM